MLQGLGWRVSRSGVASLRPSGGHSVHSWGLWGLLRPPGVLGPLGPQDLGDNTRTLSNFAKVPRLISMSLGTFDAQFPQAARRLPFKDFLYSLLNSQTAPCVVCWFCNMQNLSFLVDIAGLNSHLHVLNVQKSQISCCESAGLF